MFHLLLDIPPIREAEVLATSEQLYDQAKSVEFGGGGGGGGGGSARLPIGITFLCLYCI